MCKKVFILFAIFSFLLFSVVMGNWQVAPSSAEYEYSAGDSFTVALTLNGDGNDIDALGFDLTYPGSLLNFRRAYFEGTLLDSWMFKQTQLLSEGVLRIAGFTISGAINSGTAGKLINLVFEVKATASDEGYIFPNSFTDDLAGATGDTAIFRVKPLGYSVIGYIWYFSNHLPVPNVSISLANYLNTTSTSGEFSFDLIPEGDYVIKPEKINDIGGSVSPFDASYILRYAVGLTQLSPSQLIAGDVSGNGSVSPFDASYILQYSVGLIESFPVGRDWFFLPSEFPLDDANWNSAPDSISLSPLDSDTSGLDFKGIVMGDVTGNWNGGLKKQTAAFVSYRIEAPHQLSQTKIEIPLKLNFNQATLAWLVKVRYQAVGSKFLSAEVLGKSENCIFVSHEKNGIINLAFASPEPLGNQQIMVSLYFEKENSLSDKFPKIEICKARLNETLAQIINLRENDEFQASSFQLLQNYPNPFNPETLIEFSLKKQGYTTLQIYNTAGQLIKTLISGPMDAGNHQSLWDGRDEIGNLVASGIYFYKLKSAEFHLVKKMLLVR